MLLSPLLDTRPALNGVFGKGGVGAWRADIRRVSVISRYLDGRRRFVIFVSKGCEFHLCTG